MITNILHLSQPCGSPPCGKSSWPRSLTKACLSLLKSLVCHVGRRPDIVIASLAEHLFGYENNARWSSVLFSGWTRWWERGQLPLLPEALHGSVAEGSQVYSDHRRHEEVGAPPLAENTSWASGHGDFLHRTLLKTSNEREFEKFLSVNQTISHPGLSKGVLPQSVCSRGQREEAFWPKVYKELSVAFKQTPPVIGCIFLCFSGSLQGEQIRSGNFERMLIIEWFRMHTQQALQTDDHSHGCVFSELNQQPKMKSLTRCALFDADFFFFWRHHKLIFIVQKAESVLMF